MLNVSAYLFLTHTAGSSRIDLRLQAWNDLQFFRLILILLLLNLRRLGTALLLRLPHFHPLFHRQVLAQLGKLIRYETETVHRRAVGNGIKDDVVVWTSLARDILRQRLFVLQGQ